MKQHYITLILCGAGLLAFSTAAPAVEMTSAGCASASGAAVEKVVANFDKASGLVTVQMHLCDPVDPSNRQDRSVYRVFFDHTAPFIMSADRNGDNQQDEVDSCVNTAEVVMERRARVKDRNGLGKITPDPDRATYVLTFTATIDELKVPADAKQIYIWTDIVRNRVGNGKESRFPETGATDTCSDIGWKSALGLMIE
jgi:hypothetical protein